jgi:hypothetical protein
MLKILILGLGSIGKRYYGLLKKQNCEVGVFDQNLINKKEKKKLFFEDMSSAIKWNPNGIIICTNSNTHADLLIKCLKFKTKFFLVEKPLDINLNKIKKIFFHVKYTNKKIFVVSNLRYYEPIKILKKNISKIGKVFFSKIYFGNNILNMKKNRNNYYFQNKTQWGGIIFDCIHEIDFAINFFGKVREISSVNYNLSGFNTDGDDYADIRIKHKKNIISNINFDFIRAVKQRGCEIIGSKGSLIWRSYGKKKNFNNIELFKTNKKKEFKKNLLNKIVNNNDQYNLMLLDFLKLIRSNNKKINHHLCTLKEGAYNALLADYSYKSHYNNKIYKL